MLDVEFLVNDPTSERLIGPYVKNLQAIGVPATIRRVDPAQYERRTKSFDYDIKVQRYVMRQTPGVELKSNLSLYRCLILLFFGLQLKIPLFF